MEKLFKHERALARMLQTAPNRFFLFDFDGTLAPIAATPDQVRLEARTRHLLNRLCRIRASSVGIISGRSLKEIQREVRVPEAAYAGNHGLEWRKDGHSWVHPRAKKKQGLLRSLARALQNDMRDLPGVWVENKRLTLTLHLRQATTRRRLTAVKRVRTRVNTPLFRKDFEIQRGKLAIEIRPRVGWDKGSVVTAWTHRLPKETVVFYAGDDQTDEAAFRAVRARGIAVRIGARKGSNAAYYLKNWRQLHGLLERWVTL